MKKNILILVLSIFCLACANNLPESPCTCEDTIRKHKIEFDKVLYRILPYDESTKENYQTLVQSLLREIANLEEIILHCEPINEEQGFCLIERDDQEHWESGKYIVATKEYVRFFKTRFSGNWEQDLETNSLVDADVVFEALRLLNHD